MKNSSVYLSFSLLFKEEWDIIIVFEEELVADTTVTSSIQSPATTDTTPALTTETVTPAERTATINYVVNYVLEDGTLVNAVVKTATVTTTEAVASTSVEVAVEV
ncbi:hypothetical protein HO710_04475, partial [Streptococcus suis]|nr:hypothetical protein [Streptococcus suis]